ELVRPSFPAGGTGDLLIFAGSLSLGEIELTTQSDGGNSQTHTRNGSCRHGECPRSQRGWRGSLGDDLGARLVIQHRAFFPGLYSHVARRCLGRLPVVGFGSFSSRGGAGRKVLKRERLHRRVARCRRPLFGDEVGSEGRRVGQGVQSWPGRPLDVLDQAEKALGGGRRFFVVVPTSSPAEESFVDRVDDLLEWVEALRGMVGRGR